MTVKELYEYAKEKGILDYEIIAGYNDEGYQIAGGAIAEVHKIRPERKFIELRGLGEDFYDL